MAERNLRPEQLAEKSQNRKDILILLSLNLHVVEVNNVVKGVVPTVPVSKSTPRNVALTIDWISALVNHRVPCNEVSSAADIVAQLKYSTKVISVLESLEKNKQYRSTEHGKYQASGKMISSRKINKICSTYSTIWANSPFGRIFIAIDFCVNVARNISVVNAISSNGETCCGIVNHIF